MIVINDYYPFIIISHKNHTTTKIQFTTLELYFYVSNTEINCLELSNNKTLNFTFDFKRKKFID